MKKENNKNATKLRKSFFSSLIIGFAITLPIEISLALIAKYLLDVQISILNLLWIAAVSILVGNFTTSLIVKRFIKPITNLSSAMTKVAQGNFETQIETESKIEAIQDMYTNFNLMVNELNATETLQSDFVSNVSHEIKTPVTAIEGYATLLQDSTDSEAEKEYVNKIITNTKKLSDLVGNILLLSKVDNKTIQARKTTYRLDEQVRQAIVMLEPKWSEKNIEFEVEMQEVEYTGDEGLMFHVWNNLIDNAIKFSPENGLVRITLNRSEDKTVFTVDDEGCGINEEEIKHIFNKFYQSDSSHKAEGNGLGLALVKNILTLCGGETEVENKENGGARFTVTLS